MEAQEDDLEEESATLRFLQRRQRGQTLAASERTHPKRRAVELAEAAYRRARARWTSSIDARDEAIERRGVQCAAYARRSSSQRGELERAKRAAAQSQEDLRWAAAQRGESVARVVAKQQQWSERQAKRILSDEELELERRDALHRASGVLSAVWRRKVDRKHRLVELSCRLLGCASVEQLNEKMEELADACAIANAAHATGQPAADGAARPCALKEALGGLVQRAKGEVEGRHERLQARDAPLRPPPTPPHPHPHPHPRAHAPLQGPSPPPDTRRSPTPAVRPRPRTLRRPSYGERRRSTLPCSGPQER